MITRSKVCVTKPNPHFIGSVTATGLPESVTSALQDPTWYKAMQSEFSALPKKKKIKHGHWFPHLLT